MLNKKLIKLIERRTGTSLEQMRDEPINDYKARIEKRHNKPMKVSNWDGLVGRGSVMADQIRSHQVIEDWLSKAIR